jgi:hypothetical protein
MRTEEPTATARSADGDAAGKQKQRQQGRLMSDADIHSMVALIQGGSAPQLPGTGIVTLQTKHAAPIAPRKPGIGSVSTRSPVSLPSPHPYSAVVLSCREQEAIGQRQLGGRTRGLSME